VSSAHAKGAKPAAPSPSEVQVDLLRGLADVFSRGMDTLGGKLNQMGYSAQVYGFGKRVSPGPGFQGELTNIDLTSDMGLSHTTIEKSPRLHAIVMQKIADVVKKDLAKRMAAGKTKSNPRKKKPVASGEPPAGDRSTTDVMAAISTQRN
jgi:hypothetical protein